MSRACRWLALVAVGGSPNGHAQMPSWGEGWGSEHFYIERPLLGAELRYRLESEDRKGPFIDSRNTTHTLTERVDLEAGGFAYHPALLNYRLRLSPEWEQRLETPDPGLETSSNAFYLGYDIDLTVLPLKPYTLDLFARQQRSTLTTSLATRSESDSSTYGGNLRLKYKALPTTIGYLHAATDQSGFYSSREIRDDLRIASRREEKTNLTTFDFGWTLRERTELGSTVDTDTLYALANNRWRLAPDDSATLNSTASYRRAESDTFSAAGGFAFNSASAIWSESLNLRHAQNLSSYYDLRLSRDESNRVGVNRAAGSAGVSHTLYENLTTTVSAGASKDTDGVGNYLGALSFDYQRRIPWGSISASLGQGYTVNTRDRDAGLVQVLNEAHVLRLGDVTVLNNRNVALASVVVTNTDGGIFYLLDTDYRLETIGTSLRISRTAFGAIAEGQEVRVNYSYLGNAAYDDGNWTQSYGLGFYLWDAWRTTYRYSSSKQTLLSGTPPDFLIDDRRWTLESELQWNWTLTRFYIEDTDSTAGVSTRLWRASEVLTFRPDDAWWLSLSGVIGRTLLKDTGTQEDYYGFRADADWYWSPRSKVKFEALYQKFDGSSRKTLEKGAAARLEWYYGIWKADFGYRYLDEQDFLSGESRKRHSAFVNVSRPLF